MVMIRRLWLKYLDVLGRRPLATQMVQSSVLLGVGDVISQKLIEKRPAFDGFRTLRFMGIGCFLMAPLIKGWYGILDKVVKPSSGMSNLKMAFSKMALDQTFFAPFINFLLISVVGALQRKGPSQLKVKLQNEWPDVMKKNYQIWPGVQMVNFFFVPLLLRPLVVSFVALFWNSYLSWRTNQG